MEVEIIDRILDVFIICWEMVIPICTLIIVLISFMVLLIYLLMLRNINKLAADVSASIQSYAKADLSEVAGRQNDLTYTLQDLLADQERRLGD